MSKAPIMLDDFPASYTYTPGPPRFMDHHETKRRRQAAILAAQRDKPAEAAQTLEGLVRAALATREPEAMKQAGLALIREAGL